MKALIFAACLVGGGFAFGSAFGSSDILQCARVILQCARVIANSLYLSQDAQHVVARQKCTHTHTCKVLAFKALADADLPTVFRLEHVAYSTLLVQRL